MHTVSNVYDQVKYGYCKLTPCPALMHAFLPVEIIVIEICIAPTVECTQLMDDTKTTIQGTHDLM